MLQLCSLYACCIEIIFLSGSKPTDIESISNTPWLHRLSITFLPNAAKKFTAGSGQFIVPGRNGLEKWLKGVLDSSVSRVALGLSAIIEVIDYKSRSVSRGAWLEEAIAILVRASPYSVWFPSKTLSLGNNTVDVRSWLTLYGLVKLSPTALVWVTDSFCSIGCLLALEEEVDKVGSSSSDSWITTNWSLYIRESGNIINLWN